MRFVKWALYGWAAKSATPLATPAPATGSTAAEATFFAGAPAATSSLVAAAVAQPPVAYPPAGWVPVGAAPPAAYPPAGWVPIGAAPPGAYPPAGWVPVGAAPVALPPMKASRASQGLTALASVLCVAMVLFALPNGPMGTITAAIIAYEQAGRKLFSTRVLSMVGAAGMAAFAFTLRKVSKLENTIALLMMELDMEKQRTGQAMSTAAASAAEGRGAPAVAKEAKETKSVVAKEVVAKEAEVKPEVDPLAPEEAEEDTETAPEVAQGGKAASSPMPPTKEKAAGRKRAKGGKAAQPS